MDLAKKIQYFTLDVISTVGLGKSFGMLKEDRDVDDYIKSSEEGLHIVNFSVGVGISWILQTPWVAKLVGPSPKDAKGYGKMIGTAYRYVDERAAKPIDARSDMLASFMRHGLNGEELRSEALEQVLAGSDTTASGIRGILLYLISNPIVYGKLQSEIDDAIKIGNAPASPEIISLAQAAKLPYLQAVIREGGDTFVIDGRSYFIPGGTEIGYSAVSMHHDKGLYGDDAEHFKPERWLTGDKEKLAAMIRSNELVFGHGKFHCLGKPVAQLELNKIIFELLRNFNWGLANPEKPWRIYNAMGLFMTNDMWVYVTER
ncbi:putative cytochrome p450 protein [Phaeoacremonium minimum UCRPA7]|uniref:Putative cytochrome p450 protein n=1 Tax=Phaeoacremonium minimum (strain UCR-PA7) TaxID=1286976 RepID=R8BSI7_PHAM7|nr:putative cytochrome p450 protein [Phaeoacremonium minimum UCRPA7]EOO02301.1 putative cytochrome p450 protein [Phaeoacremonium minimum UCRPA7]